MTEVVYSLPAGSEVAAYLRVSTEQQSLGESLNGQRDGIAAEVARREWVLAHVASDHSSGRSMRRRPGLTSILDRLDDGEFSALVIWRLDRLSRSVRDTYDVMERATKKKWSLVCLDPAIDMTTPYGQLFAGLAAAFSQFERELIGQRQRESIAARKAAGTYKGPQPLVSPAAVQRMVYLESQRLSTRKIAERLGFEGHKPPKGDIWHFQTIHKILAREEQRRHVAWVNQKAGTVLPSVPDGVDDLI